MLEFNYFYSKNENHFATSRVDCAVLELGK